MSCHGTGARSLAALRPHEPAAIPVVLQHPGPGDNLASAKPSGETAALLIVVSKYTLASPFAQAVARRSPTSALPVSCLR